MKQKILILIFLLITSTLIFSQNFGGNAPSVIWKQINTDTVRIIFPQDMVSQAERSASLIHYMVANNHESIGNKNGKINIVFQNQTTLPNGYVAFAPLRSEFFTTPFQDHNILGAMNWMDALTLHEYRHVLQFQNAKRGLTKLGYYFFGEYGWAVAMNMAIPNWFLEGDAVITETALSDAGRGRLPYFSLETRALLLNDKRYNYMKARNGSFKDIVPNHYPLGFYMCTHLRNHFGNQVWRDILAEAGSYKGLIYPFSNAVKRHTGLNTTKLYQYTFDELSLQWKQTLKELTVTNADAINNISKHKIITNYQYPYFTEKGEVICVRNSFKTIESFYVLNSKGDERKIKSPGIAQDSYFSYKRGKLVWAETTFDKRWYNRNYSTLKTFDIATNKEKQITWKTKYFSPDWSDDGEKIVIVEVSPEQKSMIKIIDVQSGKSLKTLINIENDFLSFPKFADQDQSIIAISQRDSKLCFIKYKINNDSIVQLTDYTNNVIGAPFIKGDTLYFSASFSGIDNIYCNKIGEKNIYQLTSVLLGAYQPSVSNQGDELVYSDFSINGFQLKKIKLKDALWKKVEPLDMNKETWYNNKAIESEGGSILSIVTQRTFEIKDYSNRTGLINIHSWIPLYSPTAYGFELVSQNILNSLFINGTYNYNVNEKANSISVSALYGGAYPFINAGIDHVYNRNANVQNQKNEFERTSWNEHSVFAGLQLPLNLTRGLYYRKLSIGSLYNYYQVAYDKVSSKPSHLNFSSVDLNLSFSNNRKMAYQNLAPKFGQTLYFNYSKAIDKNIAQKLSMNFGLYFPGLSANHSSRLDLAYQEQNSSNRYQYINSFYYPRGYTIPNADKNFKMGFNYMYPIFYPDKGIRGLFYVNRVRANMFYDYGFSRVESSSGINIRELKSTGAELFFDSMILNVMPFSYGIRLIFLLDEDPGVPNKKYDFNGFLGFAF